MALKSGDPAARGWGQRRRLSRTTTTTPTTTTAAPAFSVTATLAIAAALVTATLASSAVVDLAGLRSSSAAVVSRTFSYGEAAAMQLKTQTLMLLGGGLAATPAVSGSLVFVSSYAGTVTTLNLTGSSLTTVTSSTQCGANPSWLATDSAKRVLYCLDEGWGQANGSLTSFKIAADGSVAPITKVKTLGGPVSSVFYGTGGRGIALAD